MGDSMRIALVRGHQLTPFETQTYAPLAKRGFEITAFASRATQFETPRDVRVVRLPSPMDGIERARGPARVVREALAYRRGVATRLDGLEQALAGFDIIHSAETHNTYTMQAANVAAATGAKLVVTVWENIPFFEVAPAFQPYRARVLRDADAFVAVTQRARDALVLEGAPPERVSVVPVGVDLQRFRPEPRPAGERGRLGVPEDALAFLFPARLTWEKGLLDVLHAMRLQDLDHGPAAGAHLVVAGRGDQEALARERAAALGIAERVHFAGHVSYDRIPDLYRATDAMVLGSIPTRRWQEQFGMVLAEAMASGAPIAVAASGSIPEVVGDVALLTQPNDARSMSAALSKLADADTRADLGARGRRRAEAQFDREKVATKIEAVYRALG